MSFGNRIDEPGGHRRALRDTVMLRAAMVTPLLSRSVDLVDLSLTGAKLRGPGLPAEGQDVLVRIGEFEGFGTIVWCHDGQCGVEFDIALGETVRDTLKRERGVSTLFDLSPEELLAAADWESGFAR